jgi:hypothetical protein
MTDPGAYLHGQPEPHRRALGELRTAIVATAPDCVETMRRGVPAFLLDGKQLGQHWRRPPAREPVRHVRRDPRPAR